MKTSPEDKPLITRYRPENLEEFVGNESTINRLKSSLEKSEGRPHVYLITGPVGCGKTTLARIIAKELDAHGFDLQEMNSANYRGIATIRDLISKANFAPMRGKLRCYILDEVHCITPEAQNASLKLLEEPPVHAYFILCTNEPDKLNEALKSRCTPLELNVLTKSEIQTLLKRIIRKEKVSLPSSILEKIAVEANGVPRHALKLLDDCLDGGEVEEKQAITKVFILQNREDIEKFSSFLFTRTGEKAMLAPLNSSQLNNIKGCRVFIIQNRDEEGRRKAEKTFKQIEDIARDIRVVEIPRDGFLELFKKTTRLDGRRLIRELVVRNRESLEYPSLVTVPEQAIMPFSEFDTIDIPKPEMLMAPWLREGSLVLLSSDAGVGKTFLAMEVAAACAEGRDAMNHLWYVDKSVPVMYVDGEMEPHDIKTRGQQISLKNCLVFSKILYDDKNFPTPLNITDQKIRDHLTRIVKNKGVKLLILDNIFSLAMGLDLNDFKQWQPINEWLLDLRRKKVAVILIHHTSRKGDQLGTASRIFNLDYSFTLKKYSYSTISEETSSFTIKVQKQRHRVTGIGGNAFICDDGIWEVRDISDSQAIGKKLEADSRRQEIAAMLVRGMMQKDIAEELGKSAPHILHVKDELVGEGLIREVGSEGRKKIFDLTKEGEQWLGKEVD